VCTILVKAALLGTGPGRPHQSHQPHYGGSAPAKEIAKEITKEMGEDGGEDERATGTSDGGAAPMVSPMALAQMLMREAMDVPSPLERMCARALGEEVGVEGDEVLLSDTALIDLVTRLRTEQQHPLLEASSTPAGGAAAFVPPPEFYVRFQALLEEMYGPIAMPLPGSR
jgi:hypothetical protein